MITNFKGEANEFQLAVPDSLQDPVGINLAILCDRVIARNWQPDGFTPANGYRIHRFKNLD